MFDFAWNSEHGNSSYYKCTACLKLRKQNSNLGIVPLVTVKDGNIVTDPDFPKSPHFCNPKSEASAIATEIDRENREVIRTTGKKPRIQFNDSVAEIPQKFNEKPEAVRDAIKPCN